MHGEKSDPFSYDTIQLFSRTCQDLSDISFFKKISLGWKPLKMSPKILHFAE